MDQQADEAIANWSLGTVMVNLLPPPLVQKALGKVVYEIGEDLSAIYKVEKNPPLFKDIAGAVASNLTAAYRSEPMVTQSHLDQLKYIPGINIWVGLVMQPHTATAMTRSVGDAYKQFFHAQVENRIMRAEDIARIAADSFRENLTNYSQAHPRVFESEIKRY